jgi:ribosomal protein S18 acetylase RimI-like enzyme
MIPAQNARGNNVVSESRSYVSLTMIRDHLENIPQYAFPPEYSIRWYRDGDESLWLAVQQAGEEHLKIGRDVLMTWYGAHLTALPRRMFFIMNQGQEPVGTATAWFDQYRGVPFGRVHWVALVPEVRGRGLSRPMMTVVCNRFRELGHTNAYLTTNPDRIAAIRLYQAFGFRAEFAAPEDAAIWKRIEQTIAGFRKEKPQ